MTALAMIIGMAPMALGLGEGGEQNAPLGRAVIGGLIFATFATLLFVPVVFSIIHARHGRASCPGSRLGRARPCRSEYPAFPRCPRVARVALRVAGVIARRWSPSASWSAASRCAHVEARKLKTWTDAQAIPTVNADPARSASTTARSLDLPGRIEAYTRAPIYARSAAI